MTERCDNATEWWGIATYKLLRLPVMALKPQRRSQY